VGERGVSARKKGGERQERHYDSDEVPKEVLSMFIALRHTCKSLMEVDSSRAFTCKGDSLNSMALNSSHSVSQ
jgi:hypothetical protein